MCPLAPSSPVYLEFVSAIRSRFDNSVARIGNMGECGLECVDDSSGGAAAPYARYRPNATNPR